MEENTAKVSVLSKNLERKLRWFSGAFEKVE